MTPRAGSGAEEHPQRISATESWMRNMQERDREQEQREQEREQRESTWNKYGRREPIRSFWRPVAVSVEGDGW
jgi:hypothetical protein